MTIKFDLSTHSYRSAGIFSLLLSLLLAMPASAQDCNENGIPDSDDITSTALQFEKLTTTVPVGSFLGLSDLTGDGAADLVVEGDGVIEVRVNDGLGSFAPSVATDITYIPIGSAFADPLPIKKGNFRNNGQGKEEAIQILQFVIFPGPQRRGTATYLIYENDSGDFESPQIEIVSEEGQPLSPTDIIVLDFNNDGLDDLAFRQEVDGTQATFVAINNGDGTKFSAQVVTTGISALYALPSKGSSGDALLGSSDISPGSSLLRIIRQNGSGVTVTDNSTEFRISDVVSGPSFDNAFTQFIVSKGNVLRIGGISREGAINITQDLPYFAGTPFPADLDGDGISELVQQGGRLYLTDTASSRYFPAGRIQALSANETVQGTTDLNADGKADLVVKSEFEIQFYINRTAGLLTAPTSADADANLIPDECQRAVASDFDGDLVSDLTVARVIAGGWYWFSRYSSEVAERFIPTQFGLFTPEYQDGLFAADYDGDGKIEPGVVRTVGPLLYWYTRADDGTALETQWGLTGDYALTGHYDSDRKADKVVVRDFLGGKRWFILRTAGEAIHSELWGLTGDIPFSGDLDGDGIDELIVARTEGPYIVWYARTLDGQPFPPLLFGFATDEVRAPFDFNGDGIDEISVVRTVNGERITLATSIFNPLPQRIVPFGLQGELVLYTASTVPGRGEVAVFRPSPVSDFASFIVNRPYDAQRSGIEVFYGLNSDVVIGHDGRAQARP